MCRILPFTKHFHAHSFTDTHKTLRMPRERRTPPSIKWEEVKNLGLSPPSPHPHVQHISRSCPLSLLNTPLNPLTIFHLYPLPPKVKSSNLFPGILQWHPNRSSKIHSGFLCSSQPEFFVFVFIFPK